MDLLERSSTQSMYESVVVLDEWLNISMKKINTEHRRTPGSFALKANKWEKYVCYFFIETVNFPDKKKEIYDKVVDLVAIATNIDRTIVDRVMKEAKAEANKLYDVGVPAFSIVTAEEARRPRFSKGKLQSRTMLVPEDPDVPSLMLNPSESDMVKIRIGRLTFEIPTVIFNDLSETAKDNSKNEEERVDLLTRLFLKYKPLGPGTGFFWSMDKRVYSFLSEDTPLPVVEGFASPFNHNLNNFCSVFNEDMKFGSKGGFFEYIKVLNVATRLIANPPYTETVLNRVADLCIDYVERVPGSEVIMMYPNWEDTDGVTKLKSNPKCQYKVMVDKEYSVHDYSIDKPITTPMALIFFVLSSGTPTVSIDEIEEQVKQAYNETVRNKSPRALSVSVGSPLPSPRSSVELSREQVQTAITGADLSPSPPVKLSALERLASEQWL